jgi:hypothetical protein
MFYTETVNSLFHLYGCGYHHNRIDATPLVAGTPKVDDDPVALYLGITTEAHRDSHNVLDYGVLSFCTFCIWPVTCMLVIFFV